MVWFPTFTHTLPRVVYYMQYLQDHLLPASWVVRVVGNSTAGLVEESYHTPLEPIQLGGSSQGSDTWLITMVIISPLRIGCLPIPNGRTLWLRNGGDPNHWTKSLDDPPSRPTNSHVWPNMFYTSSLLSNIADSMNHKWGGGYLLTTEPSKSWEPNLRFESHRNIVFQNSVGVDAGRARQNHYGSCVAVYLGTKNPIEFPNPKKPLYI